jgi:hypothetical protein
MVDITAPNCLRLSMATRPKRFLEIDLTLWGIVLYLSTYQANTLELTYEEKQMLFTYEEMIQARNIFLTVSLKGTGTSPIAYRLAQILQAEIEEAEMDGANK